MVMGHSFSVFGKLYCGLGGRAGKDCGVSGRGEETVRGSMGDYKAGHSGNRYIYSMSLVKIPSKNLRAGMMFPGNMFPSPTH